MDASSISEFVKEHIEFGGESVAVSRAMHGDAQDFLKMMERSLPLLSRIVDHHKRVEERREVGLYVDDVTVEGERVTIRARSSKDEIVVFSFDSKRWRISGCCGFCSWEDVCNCLGVSVDFLEGLIYGVRSSTECGVGMTFGKRVEDVRMFRIKAADAVGRRFDTAEEAVAAIEQIERLSTVVDLDEIASKSEKMRAMSAYRQMVKAATAKYEMEEPPKPVARRCDLVKEQCDFPGVYFAWDRQTVVYVGKSVNIYKRMRSHEKVALNDYVSFIQMPAWEADWAELFYIWLLRPSRNFRDTFGNEDFATQKIED